MLNRLFISHFITGRYLKMLMAAMLSALICGWIVTACTQQPAVNPKPSDAMK